VLKNVAIASVMVLVAMPFGITSASGALGFVLLIVLTATWAWCSPASAADRAQDAQRAATNSAGLIFFLLLFLTPSFVPSIRRYD